MNRCVCEGLLLYPREDLDCCHEKSEYTQIISPIGMIALAEILENSKIEKIAICSSEGINHYNISEERILATIKSILNINVEDKHFPCHW